VRAIRGVREDVWFYNLRVGRAHAQVEREVHAILSTGAAVLGLSEAIGYRLPDVDGYRLVRDTSTPGRANLAAYVRDDLPVTGIKWIPCRQTWKRPKGPGRHWPREILGFFAAGVQVTVGHAPPRWVDNELVAQREHLRKIISRMAPWRRPSWSEKTRRQRGTARQRPRVAILDANRTALDSGPGPAALARAIKGLVVPGNRIDVAVVRGRVEILAWSRPSSVAGVVLRSDHPHALRVELKIPHKWLTLKE